MRQIAIIPARGGSKRIEKKNIIDFHGKPMIAWTIEAALKTSLFEKVVVSTDDEEIAQISEYYGASVPFLRKDYTDDLSSISSVTINTLERLNVEANEEYEIVVQLMANCPLRNEENIISSLNHFKSKNADAQISCVKFNWMNPWWAFTLSENLVPENLFPQALKTRSQDLPFLYCPTGAIWIAKTNILQLYQTFYTDNTIFCEMPWESGVDIDNFEDLKIAKLVYLMQAQQEALNQ